MDWRPWRPGPHDQRLAIDSVLCERAARPRGGSEISARVMGDFARDGLGGYMRKFTHASYARGQSERDAEPRPLADPAAPHLDELP